MKIDLSQLNKTMGGTNFRYNDKAEEAIIKAFCSHYPVKDNGGTVGNVPEFDWILNDTKIEIKESQNPKLFIEIAKADGTPSGLLVTTSDVHMFVNPGSIKVDGVDVYLMKLRLIRTSELRMWTKLMARDHGDELKVFPPSNLGKGSAGWYLNPFNHDEIEDMFMMGFEYQKSADGNIIMDTNKIVLPPSNWAAKSIHRFIPEPVKKVTCT